MSSGYTGLVLDQRASRGFFNKVSIHSLETFETSDMITSSWHKVRTFKFDNRFQVNMFLARFRKGQFTRIKKILKEKGFI